VIETLALAAVIALALVALFWWLINATEGVYLGRRVVIALYDLYAQRYDRIKQFADAHESYYLARPILDTIPHVRAPLVLDVATGTGRLPLVLLEEPTFQGRIVGLDLSRKMLAVAAGKLRGYQNRVSLLHNPPEHLPFPDDTFDLVTCLEALEFMMHPHAVLREMVRVLRPGGLLVITNRQGRYARLMPGKVPSHERLVRFLRDDLSMARVELQRWQVEYRLVLAAKSGYSLPTGPRLLAEIWQCPTCGRIDMRETAQGWRCAACETLVLAGADGVIEVTAARPGR
jgi:ubiquinone/menaquinone biosynthesis C-methylase UbiE